MKIIGKLIHLTSIQKVSNTFKKRTFVVEYIENPQYPEYISFELIQERCEIIEPFKIGDEIEVSFNIKGRKWINSEGSKKYFNSLQAWRIQLNSNQYNENIKEKNSEKEELPF